MNDKTKQVFNGWLKLASYERSAFEEAVQKYERANYSDQKEINESVGSRIAKIYTGPLSSVCPCCGR